MHGQTATRPTSIWADLDALVLEEVEALRADPPRLAEALAFGSEEEFMVRASAFLAGHDDREQIIERLRVRLGLSPGQDAVPPEAQEELALVKQESPDSAAAPEAGTGPQS